MRILLWHVHGSWTTSFVQGDHEYLVPVTADRGPDGLGRAQTWEWPDTVVELSPEQIADAHVDVVILQRRGELRLAEQWTRRRLGRDLPAIYLEHNTPKGPTTDTEHPVAARRDIPLVHVSHFNQLFWDNGIAPTVVVEHGIVDPGYRYVGDVPRAAVAINEPVRRHRATGSDLLAGFAAVAPLDVFGMRLRGLHERYRLDPARVATYEDLPQHRLHEELPRRAVYLHTSRWTSLGLSLLEAMHLGLPVVALATTEAPVAVPPEAGYVGTDLTALRAALRQFLADPQAARFAGQAGRAAALKRYGLGRFLADWDALLHEVAG